MSMRRTYRLDVLFSFSIFQFYFRLLLKRCRKVTRSFNIFSFFFKFVYEVFRQLLVLPMAKLQTACTIIVNGLTNLWSNLRIKLKYFLETGDYGRNHVHLTIRHGFVTQHLWLGDFGKCNRGLHARTLRLRYPKSSVTFPFS